MMLNTVLLPTFKFNMNTMKYFLTIYWLLLTSTFVPLTAQAQEISLLSYNVYFDDETGKSRYPDIIKFIKQGDYNVIALQECTPMFLSLFTRDSTLRYFTRQQGSLRDGYTNIILTSLKTKQTGDIKLPSNMGRSAPFIELADSNMMIVNVHLESGLFDSDSREQQLNTILDATKKQTKLMIVGDMNFADGDDEEQLLNQFHDLGAKSKQLTYDVELNVLAQQTKFPFEGSKRLDRLFLKCKNCEVEQFNVQQFNYRKVKHSDHWPVSAVVNIE